MRVLMSVFVEYVTDMKKIYTTGEERFLSCALSSTVIKKNHIIIVNRRQTRPCCSSNAALCGHTRTRTHTHTHTHTHTSRSRSAMQPTGNTRAGSVDHGLVSFWLCSDISPHWHHWCSVDGTNDVPRRWFVVTMIQVDQVFCDVDC